MDQLPGIFVYLCVAFGVPIALARFIVRADWRTVRNSSIIWYGFLLLAFDGLGSQEGFGWALIFAMFLSIPAVPIIALILRGWNRLGGVSLAAPSATGDRQWWQRLPVSLLSSAQWFAFALLVFGIIGFIYWQDHRDLNARADVLREFFELPADAKFADIQRFSKSRSTAPRIAAIVRFTEPQFKAFAGRLDTQRTWEQGAPRYDGLPLEIISPENPRWQGLPVPTYAGERRVRWTNLSEAEASRMRNGRVLCVALQRKERAWNAQANGETPRFVAHDCSVLAQTDRSAAVVLGALDHDTKTLHMIMN